MDTEPTDHQTPEGGTFTREQLQAAVAAATEIERERCLSLFRLCRERALIAQYRGYVKSGATLAEAEAGGRQYAVKSSRQLKPAGR
jgi:hypothetical protein